LFTLDLVANARSSKLLGRLVSDINYNVHVFTTGTYTCVIIINILLYTSTLPLFSVFSYSSWLGRGCIKASLHICIKRHLRRLDIEDSLAIYNL